MTNSNGPNDPAAPQDAPVTPSCRVLGQYVKDLSFENPLAPNTPQNGQPTLDIKVDVQAKQAGAREYEVALIMNASAKTADAQDVVFIFEMVYGGLFRLENVPDELMQPFLLIECPRILFPFARRIMADTTKEGGFPPLYIDPIDFAALYQQQAGKAQPQEGQGAASPGNQDGLVLGDG